MNEEQQTLFHHAVNAWYTMVHQRKNVELIKEEKVAYLQELQQLERKWVFSDQLTDAVEQKVRPDTTVIVIEEFLEGSPKEYVFIAKGIKGQYGSIFTLGDQEIPTFEYENGMMISYCLNEAPSHFSEPIHELTEAAKKAIGELPAYRLYQETGLLRFVEME